MSLLKELVKMFLTTPFSIDISSYGTECNVSEKYER